MRTVQILPYRISNVFLDSDLDYLPRDDWKEIIQIVSGADVVIKAEGREEWTH